MKKVKMPKVDDPIFPAFTAEDIEALLKATDDARDTAIIMALLDCGARASEFCALNIEDVDMRTGAVHIRVGKNRKGRIVYLGAKARLALAATSGNATTLPPMPPSGCARPWITSWTPCG